MCTSNISTGALLILIQLGQVPLSWYDRTRSYSNELHIQIVVLSNRYCLKNSNGTTYFRSFGFAWIKMMTQRIDLFLKASAPTNFRFKFKNEMRRRRCEANARLLGVRPIITVNIIYDGHSSQNHALAIVVGLF